MEKYHTRMRPDVSERGPVPKSMEVDLGQIAYNYGLSDMVDLSSQDTVCDEQTIDDEFLAYSRAKFRIGRIPDKDILLFWKVSIRTMHYHSKLGLTLRRSMKPYSPHYTQWHSTIYLSRRQQFHVSAFSLRVDKRTQSGAIEFILSSWRPCKFLSSL
jgi:hypothetical protein